MRLSVAGLQFSYNSHPVLQDFSFQVEPGQILAVLGVNGAGKSTLLKCINKILRPKRGSVLLDERDVLKMKGRDVARHVGYVPQTYGEEELTVFDTVLLGRKPYIQWAATQRDMDIVERILVQMELVPFAMRPVNKFSGGETQKVIIARALAQEPDLLLLDEPTSNLDLKNQVEVMNLVVRAVRAQGISAVVSVHDLNLAFRFADRFLMLRDGQVYTAGGREILTPEVIYEVYGVPVILSDVRGYPVVVAVGEG